MTKIGFIGLGCEKNRVNTENMIAQCREHGFEIVSTLEESQVVVINTCGFIEDAKKEALETIFEVAQMKKDGVVKKILVTGCLPQRYAGEIANELPEVDGFIGVGSFQRIAEAIHETLRGNRPLLFDSLEQLQLDGKRALTTPRHTAYLKIADGCSNRCAFCCIPSIRGSYKSRPIENILEEARALVADGCKELILIAQDTTSYGVDLYGERRLPQLICQLARLEGLHWLRLLYLYPDKITPELIALFASEEKLLPYIEMPIQHASGKILSAMRRPGNEETLLKTIQTLRQQIPQVVLRTTLIVGFPGETEEDFDLLCRFVREARFDKLGVFCYSREEGTPAYDMAHQVDEALKVRRKEVLETIQTDVVEEKQRHLIGTTFCVLVEGYDRFAEFWYGRSYMEAPDIDGKIFFTGGGTITAGCFLPVTITETIDYDLVGIVKEGAI